MAKRHLKVLISGLSEKYQKAQELYEEAAEILSESMVDPEAYNEFCEKKNSLDAHLTNLSRILELSLDREKFLKAFAKIRLTHKRIVEILDSLFEEEKKEGFEDSIERKELVEQYMDLETRSVYSMMLYKLIDSVSSVKNRNRKYRLNIDIFGLDDKINELESVIRERL